jgi:hypothetical protein
MMIFRVEKIGGKSSKGTLAYILEIHSKDFRIVLLAFKHDSPARRQVQTSHTSLATLCIFSSSSPHLPLLECFPNRCLIIFWRCVSAVWTTGIHLHSHKKQNLLKKKKQVNVTRLDGLSMTVRRNTPARYALSLSLSLFPPSFSPIHTSDGTFIMLLVSV